MSSSRLEFNSFQALYIKLELDLWVILQSRVWLNLDSFTNVTHLIILCITDLLSLSIYTCSKVFFINIKKTTFVIFYYYIKENDNHNH